jgi:hypothetical protein
MGIVGRGPAPGQPTPGTRGLSGYMLALAGALLGLSTREPPRWDEMPRQKVTAKPPRLGPDQTGHSRGDPGIKGAPPTSLATLAPTRTSPTGAPGPS